jgi:hypothetical protein
MEQGIEGAMEGARAAGVPADGYAGLAALWHIIREAIPSGVVLLAVLVVAGVSQRWWPVGFPLRQAGVDRAIIQAQLDRTGTIPQDVDVLLIGDSSGLMGIDPQLLSEQLGGARVESLNTLGYVGPRGYGAILERFRARGGRAKRVLIVLQFSSLKRRDVWLMYEKLAVNGIPPLPPPPGLFQGARARLLSLSEPLLYIPIAGPLGDFYGNAGTMGDFIRTHHGSATEPGAPLPAAPPIPLGPFTSGVNDLFLEALPALAASVDHFGSDRARLILMPQIDWFDETSVGQAFDTIGPELEGPLHIDPHRRLDLPTLMPAAQFGTPMHLNSAGREAFTRLLADALKQDRARFPWPGGNAS